MRNPLGDSGFVTPAVIGMAVRSHLFTAMTVLLGTLPRTEKACALARDGAIDGESPYLDATDESL